MAANTTPIFPLVPVASWCKLTTANTAKDGTGSTTLLATAGTNGTKVDRIVAKSLGANVQSVLRVFLNNGGATTVSTNNSLIYEVDLPVTTLSETQKTQEIELQYTDKETGEKKPIINALPPGYKLYLAIGTAVSAGWQVTFNGSDF
jgi:hypothetical protein